MKKIISINILLLIYAFVYSQSTITGTFPHLANQQIKLVGFTGFQTHAICSVKANGNGEFNLTYSKHDYGMGYLLSENDKSFIVILSGESIKLKGESFAIIESIEIIEGKENQWFEQYSQEYPRREQALSAWVYLEKIYTLDTLFSVQKAPNIGIQKEKRRIKEEDAAFLAGLPKNTYVSWFLPIRKLVSSVSVVAQYRTEEIPSTIAAFRQIDYTDARLYKSGLYKDAIEGHFWLIENSGLSLDSVFGEMRISIDTLINNLVKDEKKLNEITDYLFDLLERHSLFQASEYLAIKVLNEVSCTIDGDLAKQLETYRAMKKGNTAPDILFKGEKYAPDYAQIDIPNKLSDIKGRYTVVVFGAAWCQKCGEELPEVARQYAKWKAQGVEVVFISLDEDKALFDRFVKNFPFISVCDFQKWNSPIAKDYYVFATPTTYLLDSSRKIVLRPNSVKQLDSWIDWYLVQGKE